MLAKILQLLDEDRPYTTADLARALGVSQELVSLMVLELAQRGYLKPVAGDCSEACKSCCLAGTCATGGDGQVWVLARQTERK